MSVNSYKNNPLSWQPDKTLLKSPIYKSLVDLLQEDILSNQLIQDTKLPSQRELADFLDLNFTTVGQAYQYAIKKASYILTLEVEPTSHQMLITRLQFLLIMLKKISLILVL